MIRHRLEYAVFREFRSAWVTSNGSGACVRLLARTDSAAEVSGYLASHPEELPRFRARLNLDPVKLVHFSGPGSETRYLYLLVEDVEDAGQLLLTDAPSKLIGAYEDEVSNPAYRRELEGKRERSLEYLATEPGEWLRRLLPITEEKIRLILAEPRIYHARCAASRVSFMGGMLGGDGIVPLGVWAALWQQGRAVFPCPSCGGVVHVFHAGRGLSIGRRGGFCNRCGAHATEESTDSGLEVRLYRINRAVEVIEELPSGEQAGRGEQRARSC